MDTNKTSCTQRTESASVTKVNPYMQPQSVAHIKPQREYSKKDTFFAFWCYTLSYLFCLTIPINENPLGAFIVIILMFAGTFAFMISKGKKLQPMPVLVGLSAVVMCFSLILTSNGFLHFFAFVYALSAYCYFLYGMSSENIFRFKDSIVIDFLKAIFVLPFFSFTSLFTAMFSGKNNKSGRVLLKILIGVFVTIIPTVIILLLLSYDSMFTDLLGRIFDFNGLDIFNHIASLIFALPVGAYVFGLFISSNDKKCDRILTADFCKEKLGFIRIAPMLTVLVAVLPILFM